MSTFNVPTREEVNTQNQVIFDQLTKQVGFVPNLYATYAYSDTALGNYLNFQLTLHYTNIFQQPLLYG